MSRHAQLPPRCPLQKKTMAPQAANIAISPPSCKDIELQSRQLGHYRSYSMLEEQPSWLNDLLCDSDSNSNGTLHTGTSSHDYSTLFNDFVPLSEHDHINETETAYSCEPDDGLGSSCMYGPNSPRRKNKLGYPEKEIVSVFSEYVMQNPLPHSDGYTSVSGEQRSDSFGDACASALKRHPGQRSRARKLQYIIELENTVDVLQDLGSELSVRISSLIQQHTALSMENNTLKQLLLRMKQEKFIVDGEYQSLNKEAERLKICLAVSSK